MKELQELSEGRARAVHAYLNDIVQGEKADVEFAKKYHDMYFNAHTFELFVRRNNILIEEE